MTPGRSRKPNRRQLIAGIAAVPLAASRAAAAQASTGCAQASVLFAELTQTALDPEATRIETAGRTVAGRFAAAYRLDESQQPFSAAGMRLLAAAVASGRRQAEAEQALGELESRFRARTRDGRWFTLDEPRKLAGHYGAVGDGRADDTAALQALIDWHVYFVDDSEGGETHIGAGTFRTTRPLHAPYGGPRRFDRVQLVGEGMVAGPGMGGTLILCDHDEAMGINFQGARYGGARELSLRGRLYDYILRNRLGGSRPALDDLDEANWADAAAPRTGDSRFAPYAGITVDAYAGAKPAGGYPDVDYPAWLPLSEAAQYGKTFSSALRFERVRIDGFHAGLVNQPCDADGNGDFIALSGCAITRCVYAISIGNTQSRNFSLNDCQGAFFHTFLTTNKHGRRNGRVQGTWKDLSVGNGINLMDVGSTAIVGPMQFDTLYAEGIFRIGHIRGGASGETSMLFSGGALNFDFQGRDGRGVPTYILGNPQAPGHGPGGRSIHLEFNGTAINRFPTVATLITDGVLLGGCTIQSTLGNSATSEPWQRMAFNTLAGGLVTARLEGRGRIHDIGFTAYDLDRPGRRIPARAREGSENSSRAVAVSHYTPSARAAGLHEMERLVNPQATVPLEKGTFIGTRLDGRMLTFTTRVSEAASEAAGLTAGGVLYDLATGMVFWVVERRDGDGAFEIIAELQNGWRHRGGLVEYETPFEPAGGTMIAVAGRCYTPTRPLFADATAGSPVLRVVGADGGMSAAQAEIRAGDRLHAAAVELQWLPGDARIVRTTPGEIVLAEPARRSVTAQRLVWLRRKPE
jgi:hypothetical protein